MAKIPGTPVGTTMPRTDFNQTDPTKADYLKGREHIATKEEWITIADTTLTEATTTIEFNKDINGNSFGCKRLVAKLNMPKDSGLGAGTFTSYIGDCYSWAYLNVANFRELSVFANSVENAFTAIDMYFNGGDTEAMESAGWYGKSAGSPHFLFTENIKLLNRIRLSITSNFPAGTQVKVWGLKA